MINWAQVRQLQEDVGKEEMAEVVELFLLEVDETMNVLQGQYDAMSGEERSASFHFLKGCAANLGFKSFGDQCSQGEEANKRNEDPDFLFSEFEATYITSKQHFIQEYDIKLG